MLAKLFHLAKSNSTGVERPKIVTETFKRAVIAVDFFHRAIEVRERSVDDANLLVALENNFRLRPFRRRRDAIDDVLTSASDSGDGEVAEPTKPVTRGV